MIEENKFLKESEKETQNADGTPSVGSVRHKTISLTHLICLGMLVGLGAIFLHEQHTARNKSISYYKVVHPEDSTTSETIKEIIVHLPSEYDVQLEGDENSQSRSDILTTPKTAEIIHNGLHHDSYNNKPDKDESLSLVFIRTEEDGLLNLDSIGRLNSNTGLMINGLHVNHAMGVTPNVMSRLRIGDEIVLRTSSQVQFRFVIEEPLNHATNNAWISVDPWDVDLLDQTTMPGLTIFEVLPEFEVFSDSKVRVVYARYDYKQENGKLQTRHQMSDDGTPIIMRSLDESESHPIGFRFYYDKNDSSTPNGNEGIQGVSVKIVDRTGYETGWVLSDQDGYALFTVQDSDLQDSRVVVEFFDYEAPLNASYFDFTKDTQDVIVPAAHLPVRFPTHNSNTSSSPID